LLVAQLGLTPLCDSQSGGSDRGHAERLVDGENVLEGLRRQAIRKQGRPLGCHKEEFWGRLLRQQLCERAEGGGLVRRTGTLAAPSPVERDGSIERPKPQMGVF
jgi:hypothetical protein